MQEDESYELQNAIKRHPYVDGFVFDVRGNIGGSVNQALQSASMVVGGGTLLTTKMRHEDDNPKGPAQYDNTDYTLQQYELVTRTVMPNGRVTEQRDLRLADLVDKPAVVLVNGDTASAAEIFAAALQQNGEATLVGTKTFGKGIGQTVFYDQPAGSRLQVTNFRFFTPNGDWIGDAGKIRHGIRPDREVENGKFAEPETSSDLQFQAAIAEINKKLGR
jgi:carboxyl-terminal processing protease